MSINKLERVKPTQAAIELNMDVESVRYLMRQERLPIGYAIVRPGSKRYTYYIYRGLLDQELERLASGGPRKW